MTNLKEDQLISVGSNPGLTVRLQLLWSLPSWWRRKAAHSLSLLVTSFPPVPRPLYESLGRIISAVSLYKLIFPEKSHKYSQCQQEKCVSLYLLALLSLPRVDLSSLVLLPCPTSSWWAWGSTGWFGHCSSAALGGGVSSPQGHHPPPPPPPLLLHVQHRPLTLMLMRRRGSRITWWGGLPPQWLLEISSPPGPRQTPTLRRTPWQRSW